MKCYYHNDIDGKCAAAVVFQKMIESGFDALNDLEMIETDYKDILNLKSIREQEPIVIVDFSFRPEVMQEILKRTSNVTWIDHHKTAMEYDYGKELLGLRQTDRSGCELTWLYYFSRVMPPQAIELIGDYDTWTFKYGKMTSNFYFGLRLYDLDPRNVIWKQLFENKPGLTLEILNRGITCERFRDSFCSDYLRSFGFATQFEGFRCYALNLYMLGSKAFGDLINRYDICIAYVFDGGKWTVSLYSEKVDVSVIASKYNGGGHIGAARFVCSKLPFERTIYEK